jgi:hypothetical protein
MGPRQRPEPCAAAASEDDGNELHGYVAPICVAEFGAYCQTSL